MANMIPISTVTVGSGGVATIEFTGIPQIYTDLEIKLSGRASNPYIDIKFNNNTSNRSSRYLYGNGSSVGSGTQAGFLGIESSTSNTSNTFGSMSIYIPNYGSSNNKSFSADSVQETNATSAEMHLVAGLWSDASPISSIQIYPEGSGTFSQYSTATLYGIRKY
jgi:hypothetical protein